MYTGALYQSGTFSDYGGYSSQTSDNQIVGFDASLSDATYGASETVQPASVKLLALIKT